MPDTFRAPKDIPNDSLPAGEVLIQAMYSSLNYKDGLAIASTTRPRTCPAKISSESSFTFESGSRVAMASSARGRRWLPAPLVASGR